MSTRTRLEQSQASSAQVGQLQQATEKRLAETEDLLRKEKESDKTRQLESRLQGLERTAKALEEQAAAAAQMGRAEGASELADLKSKYAELSAAKDKELQVALLELQALAQGQELLRAELRNSLRPLPSPPWPSLSPPPRPLPRIPTIPWHGRMSKSFLPAKRGKLPATLGDPMLPQPLPTPSIPSIPSLPTEPQARPLDREESLGLATEPVVPRQFA
ncbi:unnamed protein product [Symbiodinium natans]|uniref:Uncharacterized protein n=1 Tax=Symbiodinium natans TaxID=878477 RepID=A0A812RVJ6_9DINO|nr:unnamed protein product [Symbiodinium natans]